MLVTFSYIHNELLWKCCWFIKDFAKVTHYIDVKRILLCVSQMACKLLQTRLTHISIYMFSRRVLISKSICKGIQNCININPRQRITWLMGRWRPQQTARRHVNCRTHDHWHVERILRLIHLVLYSFNHVWELYKVHMVECRNFNEFEL